MSCRTSATLLYSMEYLNEEQPGIQHEHANSYHLHYRTPCTTPGQIVQPLNSTLDRIGECWIHPSTRDQLGARMGKENTLCIDRLRLVALFAMKNTWISQKPSEVVGICIKKLLNQIAFPYLTLCNALFDRWTKEVTENLTTSQLLQFQVGCVACWGHNTGYVSLLGVCCIQPPLAEQ